MGDMVEVHAADLRAVLDDWGGQPTSDGYVNPAAIDAAIRLRAALPWEPDEEVVRRWPRPVTIVGAFGPDHDGYVRDQIRRLHDAGLDMTVREDK